MDSLKQSFIIEARELTEQCINCLLDLEKSTNHDEILKEMFRIMHTLKGSSGFFDMKPLTNLIHTAEDLLEEIREKNTNYI